LTESERHQLIEWFRQQMGPERGELMMKAIVPVGWGDIATNRDLRDLEGRLNGEMRVLALELRSEMTELRAEMHIGMANLRTDFANGMRMQTFAILGGGSVLAALAQLIG